MGVSSFDLKGLPPGFRFSPTDEELVCHYLKKKSSASTSKCGYLDFIQDVDLYSHEPSELPGMCSFRGADREWFFFTQGNSKKYTRGSRLNRSTDGGYWKTTGRDREVVSKGSTVGMKKTLVFHSGRAPRGQRTGWVMHEYRLADDVDAASEKDSFVLCRVFLKNVPEMKTKEHRDSYQGEDSDSACYALAAEKQQKDVVVSPVTEPEIKESNSTLERSIASSVEDCNPSDYLQQCLLEWLEQPDKKNLDDFLHIQAGDVASNIFVDQYGPNDICTLNNDSSTLMHEDTVDLMSADFTEQWNYERLLSPGVLPGDYIELDDFNVPLDVDSIF